MNLIEDSNNTWTFRSTLMNEIRKYEYVLFYHIKADKWKLFSLNSKSGWHVKPHYCFKSEKESDFSYTTRTFGQYSENKNKYLVFSINKDDINENTIANIKSEFAEHFI